MDQLKERNETEELRAMLVEVLKVQELILSRIERIEEDLRGLGRK